MNVGLIKEMLSSFTTINDYPFNQIWSTLHLPPKSAEDSKLECYKPMLRLMIRFIDLHYQQPLTAARPPVQFFKTKLNRFFSDMNIPDETDISIAREFDREGFVFWALFHVFAWFKNLEIMDGTPDYFPIMPLEEIRISDFKILLENFVNPREKELKMIWQKCKNELPSNIGEGEACHKYSLRLFFYTLQFSHNRLKIFPEPTINELRNMTLDFLKNLSWQDDKIVLDIALTDPDAVHLIAMYDIIQSYYCLPRPEVVPRSIKSLLSCFGL